jgi:hypothetical protein
MACHVDCYLTRANSRIPGINCSKMSVASESTTYLVQCLVLFQLCCCCHSGCANGEFYCIEDKLFCRDVISKSHEHNCYEECGHKAEPLNFPGHPSHKTYHMRHKPISNLSQSEALVECAVNEIHKQT